MEKPGVLVDTSILIEFIRNKQKKSTILWELMLENKCYISVVSIFELYNGATDTQKKQSLDRIIKWLEVLEFNFNCSLKASSIYLILKKSNKLIEFRDIFIASTSITYNIPIATTNLKHFERIPDISLVSNNT